MKSTPTTPWLKSKPKQPFYTTTVFQVVIFTLLIILVLSTVVIPIALIVTRPGITTMTTITTTPASLSLNWTYNETVYGVWNTYAGGDASLATVGTSPGTYFSGQTPLNACDNDITDIYTSFGNCTSSQTLSICGSGTGFYVTPLRGASTVTGFQVCTQGGASQPRDPVMGSLEGSNQPASALLRGSSWTLLYSGTTGITPDPGRLAWGTQVTFSNRVSYTSYRFLVTSIRGNSSSSGYAEVQLIGY